MKLKSVFVSLFSLITAGSTTASMSASTLSNQKEVDVLADVTGIGNFTSTEDVLRQLEQKEILETKLASGSPDTGTWPQ